MFLKKGTRDLRDSANQAKNAESALDSAESQNLGENQVKNAESNKNSPSLSTSGARGWVKTPSLRDSAILRNLVKNNSVRSTQTRPLRGAKNRIQASSSASADFLLEADKRGSPPKSEKAATFWRVGGAGRGVQPFLREKISEISGVGIAESIRDSSPMAQNDNFILNLTLFAESPQIPTKYALKG